MTETVRPSTNSARLAARPILDGGTPLGEWTRWQRRFPALDLGDCPAMVLVAAHPDDETLGLGATAAMLSRRGVTVQIVAVTDGEAAYPDTPDGREGLARLRRDELKAAAHRLGLPKPIFLRMPDGEVATHEMRLTIRLEALLAGFDPGAWCAATWRGDGHPDHEATGRAAAAAARSAGAVFVEYPIWMWHWATPDDPAVPWQRARSIEVASADLAVKTEAVRCFASQVQRADGPPLLPSDVIERQLAVGEIVFVG
ncbi:PIG-L family deacetylase [Mycolicibacterium moriokaense]|nr:PIG-L family deacetylase [Mycolicibacterium moriokaense]